MDKATANKILKSATLKLQKQFGDDVFLDTVNTKNIPSISTGSMLIDKDTGVGGIPLGRVTEVFGENSSGKCLTGDTLIRTPYGLETIASIFKRNKVYLSEEPTTTEVQTLLYNEYYELESTTHFTCNGRQKVIQVSTESGNVITGTYNHPLRVLKEDGTIDWVNLEDLKLGDKLVSRIPVVKSTNPFYIDFDKDIDFIHSRADIETLSNLAHKNYGEIAAFFKSYIYFNGRSERWSANIITIGDKSWTELFLIKQILMNTFGLLSSLSPDGDTGNYILTIKDENTVLYRKLISNFKPKKLSVFEKVKMKLGIKNTPYQQKIKYKEVYETITKLDRDLPRQLTFDFAMEKSASFLANGIASHNTSICSSTIVNAQRQYPDKKVLFVDTEQAYDLNYARQFGVDTNPENFIFTQPNSIEEAFEIMITLAETGLFSLMVLDSVGASPTMSQLAKGMDETTMGALAKKMSEGLTKLKPVINKTDTAVIMVNQVYSKMSLYASNAKETKGGSALKFTASLRIEVKKRDLVASESDKDIIVGQAIEYIFRKNKVGQPYLQNETFLYFGKGFDRNREIIDIAISENLITRGGAWYNFNAASGEALRFQGKEKVIEYLTNSPEDLAMFEKQVLDSLDKTQPSQDVLEQIEDEEDEEDNS